MANHKSAEAKTEMQLRLPPPGVQNLILLLLLLPLSSYPFISKIDTIKESLFAGSASFKKLEISSVEKLPRQTTIFAKPSSQTNASPLLNFVQTFMKNQIEISLGVGVMGLMLILLNRSLSWNAASHSLTFDPFTTVSDIRSRADIIAVIACSGLLLNIFSDTSESNVINQEIIGKNMREREKISLVGYYLAQPIYSISQSLNETEKKQISWLDQAIRSSIPAVTSIHWLQSETMTLKAAVGVVSLPETKQLLEGEDNLFETGKILKNVISKNQEVYLPDLQILPGKIEFTYLPINCQSVLIIPLLSRKEVLIIATNQAKSLKLKELNKIRIAINLYGKL